MYIICMYVHAYNLYVCIYFACMYIICIIYNINCVVVLDQILSVLLTSSMFVGGFIGFLLDNIFPGVCVLHNNN